MNDTTSPQQTIRHLGRRTRQFLALIAVAVLAACASSEEPYDAARDIQEAYDKASSYVDSGNYQRGIEIFEILQARFPFSDFARQIQLDLMHAYYKSGQTELAIETADTFMRENPIHPNVDYALYIKGLAYFDDGIGFLERTFRKDTSGRPPKDVDKAYQAFRRLVERYPASQYGPDAHQRMVFLKNRLATYENSVAEYYLRRGAFIAALNRAKNALEAYNGAESNDESLRLLITAYEEMGMDDLAADARRVLELNFPDS